MTVAGIAAWVGLVWAFIGYGAGWGAVLVTAVLYLWFRVMFEMARRSARLPRRHRQWLFVP